MATIQFQLLGQFQLCCDNEPVTTLHQGRLQSLLAYLALHRHVAQPRQHLAFLFWPESTEAQALTNLRKQLLYLRRAWPIADRLLHINAKNIEWQPSVRFELDVEQCEAAFTAAASLHGKEAIAALQQANELYQGDLLPSCYDEWLIDRRETLRANYGQALERLLLLLEDQRDYAAAIAVAQQLLRHDPLLETAYRRLMRLYALQGDRAAALLVYQTCVEVLRSELAVEPGVETQQAYERLLNHQVPQVLRASAPSALEVPPFVGRQAEWQLLQAIWRDVARGHAHLLVISGEAGIGKTRLAEELMEWAQYQGILTARAHAYAAEGQLAYAPVVDWLRTPALQGRLARLEETWLVEVARLLPELISDHSDPARPEPSAASWQRHRLFEALAHALLVDRQPLLLLLDDLHWCDQETLAWLHFLLRYAPQARLLIVTTVRLGEVGLQHPLVPLLLALRHTPQLTELALVALDMDETTRLAEQMVGRTVSMELARRFYRETEGHPLYIVEMVRAHLQELRETPKGWFAAEPHEVGSDTLTLTPRIHAVIDTRLAQLSPLARKVADLAAVIGRDFTFEVLALALEISEDELVQGLDELLERQIVRERQRGGYDFSHDKLREAIYLKISNTRRRVLHRRIAQAIEVMQVQTLDEASSQIARHYDRGDLPERAVPAYARAGLTARRVHARAEACELFQRGLALLADLPSTPERLRLELDLLLGLGPALVALHGYSFAQVKDVYLRAQWIIQTLDAPPNPAILRALALFYIVRRDYAQAIAQGEQLCALASAMEESAAEISATEPSAAESFATEPFATEEAATKKSAAAILYAEGHYVLGVTAFWHGEYAQAKEHLERALDYYDVRHHEVHTALYTQDPGVICHVRLALTLWYMGDVEEAQQQCAEGIALARRLGHPFTEAYALNIAAWLYTECQDAEITQGYITELLSHSEKHNLPYWLPVGLVYKGYALALQGEIETGLDRIRTGMQAYQTSVLYLYAPYILAALARVYALAGAVDQGIAALDEAFAGVAQHGDPWYNAELYRLKGELLMQQGASLAVVESHYQQALTLAQRQQARSLELRAALNLSQLWQQQGKQTRARKLLASVYQGFNGGFETTDLQNARALLAELGQRQPPRRQ